MKGRPLYETPLGLNFDPAWIKAARELRRKKMVEPPPEEPSVEENEGLGNWPPESAVELDDWEKNIIMFSGYARPFQVGHPC